MRSLFKKQSYILTLTSFLCILLLSAHPLMAQKKKKKKEDQVIAQITPTIPKKDKVRKVTDAAKNARAVHGLLTLYQDTTSGDLKMLIKEEQLNKDFIHFYYIENGVVEANAFRGQFKESIIFRIEKYYDHLEFVQQNTSYYFDEDNALSHAADANISRAVLHNEKILAGNPEEGYLIDADALFLQETMGKVKPDSPSSFKLGGLSRSKTKYLALHNYPQNTDVLAEYVYESSTPFNKGSDAVTDARSVSLQVQHSFIAVPDNGFQPRYDDPRVGFFSTKVTDLTSLSATPYRDVIHRWDLRKKDPAALVSEPVQPIVFWIENTTPVELREVIKKAGNTWNGAFEKAGFKNAIQIRQQPDDAAWTAGDLRYNVIRWTSSPTPPFGGYGPSFVNPRTGQILGADIMLEYASLGKNMQNQQVFAATGLEMYLHEASAEDAMQAHYCMAGLQAGAGNFFGAAALQALSEDEAEKAQMSEEFLYYLVLHEMGHTFGLSHNMKSSQLHNTKNINNVALTSEVGLVGSVMDYPEINFALHREEQGQYWPTRPGPYDLWAIAYGYKPMTPVERLALLAESTKPELSFGNDADDMRSPGKGIDPRVNVNDLTLDAISFATDRLLLTQKVSQELLNKFQKQDQSYQELRNAYLVLTTQQARAANTISRYIGGVYVDRSFAGQQGAKQPFTPVPLYNQKRAMKTLSKYVFAPDAFKVPAELYGYLQMQRRGFDFYGKNEDPQVHDRVLTIQKTVLAHLLHPNVLERITDSELYGNTYSLSAMLTDLNKAIFAADRKGNINTFRQNLQIEYLKDLVEIMDSKSSKYSHVTQTMAFYHLKTIREMVKSPDGNTATKAHRARISYVIDKVMQTAPTPDSSLLLN